MRLHARMTMELELKDETCKDICNRIQSGDKIVASELYALFKQWGKVVDGWDSYIPGPWLSFDAGGDGNEFDDINF